MHVEAKQINSEQVQTNRLWLCTGILKPSNGLPDPRKMPSSPYFVTYVVFEVIGHGQAVCILCVHDKHAQA